MGRALLCVLHEMALHASLSTEQGRRVAGCRQSPVQKSLSAQQITVRDSPTRFPDAM